MRVLLKKRFMLYKISRSGLEIKVLLLIIALILSSFAAYSHGADDVPEEEINEEEIGLEQYIRSTSSNYILIASIIATTLILFSIYHKGKSEKAKFLMFLGIVVPIIIATVYSAGSTIYLNLISETQGPVHWHADFEIWDCGKKIDLKDPEGFSNKIGSAVFHEHGDDRIHVEGVVVERDTVDLHNFFEIIGGSLTANSFSVPTHDGYTELRNGDLCNGQQGKLQAFLYKINNPEDNKNWVYEQQKLENFEDYVLSPYASVPPGDCIIIELDAEKEKTEHICSSYEAGINRGDLSGG
jgi:hypothetical protein